MPQEVLRRPTAPHQHSVQLYGADAQNLASSVGKYMWEGLKRDEGVLIIATQDHIETFADELERLGLNALEEVQTNRLRFLDAEETLARFMVNGRPDRIRFENTIRAAVREIRTRHASVKRRAYGEMVGLLWTAAEYDAAIELERLWNELVETCALQLFCGYPIDVFGSEFHGRNVEAVLHAHSEIRSASSNGDLENAVDWAMHDVLGHVADSVRTLMSQKSTNAWAAVPAGEAAILWLRDHLPQKAEEIVARARQRYHSEKRFRALVENSADAISLLDTRARITYTTAATFLVLGYEPHELIGSNILDLAHPEDAGAARRLFQESLGKPRCPLRWEGRLLRKSGTTAWVEGTINNLLDEPGVRAIVCNYRDITERKNAEQDKAQRTAELVRSNADLQAFVYAAAHDLAEPLRTVCAYTQLLQRSASESERQEFAGIVVDGVTRMGALLDGLLAFARLDFSEPFTSVDLERAADQAAKNLDHAVKESGTTIVIESLPVVHANESHFIEVFQNLIGNAIKYRAERPLRIRISSEATDHGWLVKIQDNGIGIPAEYRDQIFELFKRLHDRSVPGTGIGLAICKKIIQGMGGEIWVESESGQGSKFCFSIPRLSGPGISCERSRIQ